LLNCPVNKLPVEDLTSNMTQSRVFRSRFLPGPRPSHKQTKDQRDLSSFSEEPKKSNLRVEGANGDRDGRSGLIIIEVIKDGLSFPERWEKLAGPRDYKVGVINQCGSVSKRVFGYRLCRCWCNER
jgi:hypothetical protein